MMKNVKHGMECIGLKWNEKKCAVMHVTRGSLVSDGESMKIDGLKPINCLREDSHYKFLGVRESVRLEDGLVLELEAKEFLRRVESFGLARCTTMPKLCHPTSTLCLS